MKTARKYVLAALALWPSLAFGQTLNPEDAELSTMPDSYTITADTPSSLVFSEIPDPAEYWKTVTLMGNGNPCHVYEFVEASVELEKIPETFQWAQTEWLPTPERMRLFEQWMRLRAAALERWRKTLGECAKAIGVEP